MLGTALSHGIKPQQQRNLGSPIASFKACPEKFYWVKRKAAVHGTKVTETRSQKLWLWSGNQNPKGPLLSWQGRLMKRGDKDQFRDEAPWNPVGFSQRNPLSHVWRLGLHTVCPLLMFPALLTNLLHSLDLLEFHQHIMLPPTTGPLYMMDWSLPS